MEQPGCDMHQTNVSKVGNDGLNLDNDAFSPATSCTPFKTASTRPIANKNDIREKGEAGIGTTFDDLHRVR
jgi:hypothetical protein